MILANGGVYPALWTPTDAGGALLAEALADQVRFLRGAGADGAMVLGSTGEFVHLEMGVRREVLTRVAEAAPGWPIIANCSDVSPLRVAALGRHSRAVGAAAVALLPPWFFESAREDVVEFLVRGAEASGLPLVLYNFPERTGHRLELGMVAAVAERVRVVAVKQSGAPFGYHRELAELGREKGFVVITGADTRIADALAHGANGVVSGLANAVPEWVVSVYRAAKCGDASKAATSQGRLASLAEAIGGLAFPLDVAAAMEARGRVTGAWKAVVSPSTAERYRRAVERCRAILGEGAGEACQRGGEQV
ncbi:MAG: dihydrodipicolinate synthase family protein [Verrucomicrobiae bacterium]|nr:dihydrodipicolinate synthase family protein [Verrucomicrobiae bacterium]